MRARGRVSRRDGAWGTEPRVRVQAVGAPVSLSLSVSVFCIVRPSVPPSPQGPWAPKKEPYARELLAISFISAVNRKRKKRRGARGLGSSTDDDSEQEARRAGAGAPDASARERERERDRDGDRDQDGPGRLSPPAAPADTRSIVSGYSTLSTMDRSECSGAGGRRAGAGAGDEADDERSELSHVETETDTEGAGSGGARPGRRPSFSSHRLMPCDTLARRRLARSRPDADAGAGAGLGACAGLSSGRAAGDSAGACAGAGSASASSSSQESLRPLAAVAALGSRPSRLEALRLRLRGTADDMLAVRLRRPVSPETRRRRSSWRRHTVVVQSPLTDLNFNEWKELGGGGGTPEPPGPRAPHSDNNKDSGLSSLESTKARASPAAPAPGEPGAPHGQPPRRSVAARLHQCL